MNVDRLVGQAGCFWVLYDFGPETVYYTLILDTFWAKPRFYLCLIIQDRWCFPDTLALKIRKLYKKHTVCRRAKGLNGKWILSCKVSRKREYAYWPVLYVGVRRVLERHLINPSLYVLFPKLAKFHCWGWYFWDWRAKVCLCMMHWIISPKIGKNFQAVKALRWMHISSDTVM